MRLEVQARDLLGLVVAVEAVAVDHGRLLLAVIADKAAAGRKHAGNRQCCDWTPHKGDCIQRRGFARGQRLGYEAALTYLYLMGSSAIGQPPTTPPRNLYASST